MLLVWICVKAFLFMKMGLRALVIIATAVAVVGLAGCSDTPSIRIVETIGVSDSAHTPPSTIIRVVENIGVADSPQTSQPAVISVAETIGVTDLPQMLLPAVITVVESITVTDSPVLQPVPAQPPPPPQKITVAVASPKAGEVWRVGTAQSVAWNTTGEGIAYVDIYYSTDGGKSMISIARSEPSDGIYTWKVPNTPAKTVLVRVLAFNIKRETLALGDSGLFTISIQ
jgi:hypothetical protein